MINCKASIAQGRIETNKQSELHKKLLKAFPDRLNAEGGSLMYDNLFSDEFKSFFGDWTSREDKWNNYFLDKDDLLDELGEPKLFLLGSEYYFLNGNRERYVLNERLLSEKDKLETINSLSLEYIKNPNKPISEFIKDTLEQRESSLSSEYLELSKKPNRENFLKLKKINESIISIRKDILDNPYILDSISKSIEANLADYNLKYLDEADTKEDEDPNTNDEISNFTKESSEVRDTNNIDKEIKIILASIPDSIIDLNGDISEKKSRILNMPMAKPANEVKNRVISTLSNIIELELAGSDYISDPYDLMIDKLRQTANENNDVILDEFLKRIEATYNSRKGLDKEAFKNKFVTGFYKAQNIFTITEISENNGKLILRHIDPSNSQDRVSVVSQDIGRSIINRFPYISANSNISNSDIYSKASEVLRNFKTKKDIINGLEMLGITLDNKTVNNLFKNKDNVLQDITKVNEMSLKELFTELFNQNISYYDTDSKEEKKTSTHGLKEALKEYSQSNIETQKNIISALIDKDNLTPINILSRYESLNRSDIGDMSYFVGSKQRWMLSLVSGLNKEILNWKAGNIKSLQAKKHKNLVYIDYLLDLDNVKKGLYEENSPENINERNKRISNLKLIINSELKNTVDSSPIQHKEIGEADLHMDIFFKMFNHKDEIYEKIDKQQGLTKKLKNSKQTRSIYNYGYSADKGGSYSIGGLLSMDNNTTVNEQGTLIGLGYENEAILKNYLLGEFETIIRNSALIQGYLNKKTKKQKQEYLMKYLIPEYHYVTSLKTKDIDGKDITIKFNPEDQNDVLDFNLINNASWNKFGFFNSISNNHKAEFNVLFTNVKGVKLADPAMRSHITNTLYKLAAGDIIEIANNNAEYLDNIKIEQSNEGSLKLFDKPTNIQESTNPIMKYNYIVNSIFNNMEMFNLFNGDLAFYKQKGNTLSMEDALKRGPAILTDGLYIRQSSKADNQEYISYTGEKIPVDKNRDTVVAVLNVLENDTSKFADRIQKATDSDLSYQHEIADAQGFITLDFYKKMISGVYGWTNKDEQVFNRLSDKNHKFTHDDIVWLKAAGKSMQSLKLTGFNLEDIIDENGNIIGQNPVYLKYSTAVLAPAIIAGTDVEKLAEQMSKQNVDQVVFKSGSKASNKATTTIFNKENGIFSGLKSDMKLNPFTFKLSGLKLQVELPTKFDKEGVLGNQHLKNLLANLDIDNANKIYKFRDQKLSAQELQNEYDSTVKNILQNQLNSFSEKINIKNNDGNLSFSQEKLRELITSQLDVTTDGDLIEILSDSSIPLETIPGIAQRAYPILASFIHKNVGKVLTNAGSAIQVANIGFDKISKKDANNVIFLNEDTELRPPLPITDQEGNILYFDEDGNSSTDSSSGRMKISKARIMLPFSSIYDKTGMSYEGFKAALKSGNIDNEIFQNVIGYRIPNQSISSNDAIEVVGILPPNMGDTAIVYHEITAKTGSDFDIDKMYLMMPNYSVKGNKVSYITDENTNEGQQNKLIELMGSILTNANTYDDLISPLDSDIPKDAINEVLYLKSIVNEEDYDSKLASFKSLKGDDKSKFLKSFAERRKLNPLQQLAPVGMVRSRVDMLQAKKLVATMANHMTDIPMSQIIKQIIKFDLGVGSHEFSNIFTKGHEGNNEYKLTKIVSYLMNAAVDAAKDNYIIEGNFNSYTANGAMVMIRMGIEPVDVFKVLLNEDILRLSKIKQLQTQKITNINTDYYSQEILNNYSRNLVNYLQTNKLNFNDFIKEQENLDSNLILGFWNIIQLAGKELNNDVVSAKSDSNGAGKTIYDHHTLYNRLYRLEKESIGSVENNNFVRGKKLFKQGIDINNLDFTLNIDDRFTFLGAMMNNSLFLTNFVTRNMFIENTDNYRYIVNRISNQLGEPLPISSDTIKLVSNYIYPYILSQSGHKLYNIDEPTVEYLQKSFMNEVLDKKRGNPDNYFLKELYIDANTNLISFPNYKYYDANTKVLLRESMEDLFKQKDTEGKPSGMIFMHRLVKYAFLTTGFKPTFFSMNEYLPKSYFLNTGHGHKINRLIDRLNNSSEFIEDEFLSDIMTFIAINNDNNYKVVANLYKTEGLVNNSPIKNKKMLEKLNITDTENYYPFVRNKKDNILYMLTDVTKDGPIYNVINSNSEEVVNENTAKLKKKTKVKYYDLNTLKPENLFKESKTANALYIQPEIEYVSELSSIFNDNNLTVENDSISLQNFNKLEMNKEEENTYGLSKEEWNNLTEEEQDKIKECN